MPSPYATIEDPKALWYEQSLHASTHIGAMAFGVLICVYYLTLYHGIRQKKISWWWILYNSTLVAVATVNIATSIHYNETAWIDERNYPGGPYAFLVQQQNRPVMTVGNTAYILASTLAEGLLLYRVFVLWRKWYVTIFTTLYYLVNTAFSIVTVIQLALPFSPTWTHIPSFEFPVWLMWVVFNIFLTFLLAGRLLYLRHKLRRVMGKQYGKIYTSVAAIVIESALPFGILSLVYIGIFGKKDPTENLFIELLVQVECLSPMLIILRVIRGQAWSSSTIPGSTATTATTVELDTLPSSGSHGSRTLSVTRSNEFSDLVHKQLSKNELHTEETRSNEMV